MKLYFKTAFFVALLFAIFLIVNKVFKGKGLKFKPTKKNVTLSDNEIVELANGFKQAVNGNNFANRVRTKFLELYAKIKTADDFYAVSNQLPEFFSLAWLTKTDLIGFTNLFFEKQADKDTLNKLLEPKLIFVFSDRKAPTECGVLKQMQKYAPESFNNLILARKDIKKAAQKCGLI
jgi:hypothetical protein